MMFPPHIELLRKNGVALNVMSERMGWVGVVKRIWQERGRRNR